MSLVKFHVVPNAAIDKIVGSHGDAIKVKLRAPAAEGKANVAVRDFLAGQLQIARQRIVLEHGEKSRTKLIRIDGLSESEVRRTLKPISPSAMLSALRDSA